MRVQVVCRLFPQHYAGVLYIPCADLVVLREGGSAEGILFCDMQKNCTFRDREWI